MGTAINIITCITSGFPDHTHHPTRSLPGCPAAQNDVGALTIRIGFFGPLHSVLIIRIPENNIGNY